MEIVGKWAGSPLMSLEALDGLRPRLCPRVWVACARVASLKLKNISVYKSPFPCPQP